MISKLLKKINIRQSNVAKHIRDTVEIVLKTYSYLYISWKATLAERLD